MKAPRFPLGTSRYRIPASINRWTVEPHKHRREIARNTTKPGTQARRDAMAEAKKPS